MMIPNFRFGDVWKDFVLEKRKSGKLNIRGRPMQKMDCSDICIVVGCLADATPDQKFRWQQLNHTISHTIIKQGEAEGTEGDRLILGKRVFDIEGIDDIGSLGLYTMYYTKERVDINGQQCNNSNRTNQETGEKEGK